MNFYDNFNANKKRFGLNNKTIGEVIDMKPDALRMAITRKSLTKLEIKEIEKLFDKNEKLFVYVDDKHIDSLFKSEYFKEKLTQFIESKKQ